MLDIVRDSAAGQLARLVYKGGFLAYSDEKPASQAATLNSEIEAALEKALSKAESHREPGVETPSKSLYEDSSRASTLGGDVEQGSSILQDKPKLPVVIDFASSDDPENPQNWSVTKKSFVAFTLNLYTFTVYIGSSIYVAAEQQVSEEFGVDATVSSLGIALYVFAYGIGPMLWSPLSEIPYIGRNPPYIATFAVFVILLVASALTPTFSGLLITRFLLGFFGSPCLATAGASFQDMFSPLKIPYTIVFWAGSATLGPALGPMISGFSVPVKGWRWPQWELLWLAGPTFLLMLFFLPETSSQTILLRRAERLQASQRRNGQDLQLTTTTSLARAKQSTASIIYQAVIKPWEINILDPAVLFSTLYTGLVYGIFYSFFESFPLVYIDMYGFNLGETGLAFLSVGVALFIAGPSYALYWYLAVERHVETRGFGPQEDRLLPGLVAGLLIPVGLFMFGWTAGPSIHWIVPTIGICISTIGIFLMIQVMLLYVSLTYPPYAASLFAANDFARASLAGGAILFSPPMYRKLGIAGGSSLLAGLTIVCVILLYVLYNTGAKLRARSRFAAV